MTEQGSNTSQEELFRRCVDTALQNLDHLYSDYGKRWESHEGDTEGVADEIQAGIMWTGDTIKELESCSNLELAHKTVKGLGEADHGDVSDWNADIKENPELWIGCTCKHQETASDTQSMEGVLPAPRLDEAPSAGRGSVPGETQGDSVVTPDASEKDIVMVD